MSMLIVLRLNAPELLESDVRGWWPLGVLLLRVSFTQVRNGAYIPIGGCCVE